MSQHTINVSYQQGSYQYEQYKQYELQHVTCYLSRMRFHTHHTAVLYLQSRFHINRCHFGFKASNLNQVKKYDFLTYTSHVPTRSWYGWIVVFIVLIWCHEGNKINCVALSLFLLWVFTIQLEQYKPCFYRLARRS